MNEFKIIEKYLMNYSGAHYKKPIDEYDNMMKIKYSGQDARNKFIKLGNSIISKFSDFNIYKCNSWIGLNQVIPNYLWIQFKKEGFENYPFSISVVMKKVKEICYLYVAVEIKDSDAKDRDFKNHNKILNISLSDLDLYYSGDKEGYFNLGTDSNNAKNMIKKKLINKVRIQKNINYHYNIEQKEVINNIVNAIKVLEPYYNEIISNYKGKNNNQEWIIPCNPLKYNIIEAFSELNKVNWKQSTKINKGDIVYIYVGNPFKEIKYKCIVTKANLDSEDKIDDSKFILDGSNYENYGRYMELKLLEEYKDDIYSLIKLKKHGLKSVQGPSRVKQELSNYIKLIEVKLNKRYLEENNNEDEILIKEIRENEDIKFSDNYEYKFTKKEKQNPKIKNGVNVYIRDKKVATNALAHAKYLCEIDKNHPTFVRKNIDINYTEPHHLIPLAYSDFFDVSLDVEENIVSLCSNCHNLLHYGRDFEKLLKKLYDERIEYLEKVGLYIKFEKLLEMYN